MEERPTPALRPAGMPVPSSEISSATSSSTTSCTTQLRAPACRATVRERLLRDSVDGHFDGRGEGGKILWHLDSHARLLVFRAVALGKTAQSLR